MKVISKPFGYFLFYSNQRTPIVCREFIVWEARWGSCKGELVSDLLCSLFCPDTHRPFTFLFEGNKFLAQKIWPATRAGTATKMQTCPCPTQDEVAPHPPATCQSESRSPSFLARPFSACCLPLPDTCCYAVGVNGGWKGGEEE